VLDDLPEIAADAFGSCFPGCLLAILTPLCAIGAAVAFAIGDTEEAWTMVFVAGLGVAWALAGIARWWWRRTDA
jgi:Na+-transporting NADH:ubiquinone oxidoreductase subunit NqrE